MKEIVEFVKAQMGADEAIANEATSGPWQEPDMTVSAGCHYWGIYADEAQEVEVAAVHVPMQSGTDRQAQEYRNAAHIARHGPVWALAVVAFMRRIVELHTTGVYRTYQCSNGDHLQEWQCERANEPYTEHRYCEVCGNECVEVPLLAGIWVGRPGFKPEWRMP